MTRSVPITVAHGDGIGPEIMTATLQILKEAGARLEVETIEIGEAVYKRGHSSGIEASSWDSLRRTKVFLKAPITTPQGGGFKSLNVTVRKTLGLYANIRPNRCYAPFVHSRHGNMDLMIVRENEEDTYAGIEYKQTDEVTQCLKIITRPGSEKLVRYGFEFARANNRKKVTCFTKDNIMKMTDGLFHKVFDEVSKEYPEITTEHWIVDIGMAKVAATPEEFDVIVLPNLYGDILSDITAQIAGSVGLAGSANIGDNCAMFEAIHGSAPRRAGQNVANPSGILLGGVMMLVHIGQADVAERIHNAFLKTIEDGVHTYDIYREGVSKQSVGTKEFAQAIISRLGQKPSTLTAANYSSAASNPIKMPVLAPTKVAKKELLGVDVFLHWRGEPNALGEAIKKVSGDGLELKNITNRGVKVWPNGMPETFCTDHWQCRFTAPTANQAIKHSQVVSLLQRIAAAGFDFIQTENLYSFDGERGYSLGQGE